MSNTIENNKSNSIKKDEGKAFVGGESSADYIISKSEGDGQLSENARISPTSPSPDPTPNVLGKEIGD